jgi:TnpA family transposase
MARRELLTEEERASLFGVPTERAALARHYTLGPDDLDFLAARRGDANRLGAATWMALLRHPGFGLRHDEAPPRELVAYLADQLGLPEALFGAYGGRAKTRLEHGWDVAAHLGVRVLASARLTPWPAPSRPHRPRPSMPCWFPIPRPE